MAASAGQRACKQSDTAHARRPLTTAIGIAVGPGFRREFNERKIPSVTRVQFLDQVLDEINAAQIAVLLP